MPRRLFEACRLDRAVGRSEDSAVEPQTRVEKQFHDGLQDVMVDTAETRVLTVDACVTAGPSARVALASLLSPRLRDGRDDVGYSWCHW